jgi:hypothetical protein
MGHSVSWVAVRRKLPDTALSVLSLRRTGEYSEVPFSPGTWGAELPDNWYLVFGNHADFVDQLPLDQLAADAEVVACSVEEHVMMSYAQGWSKGEKTWSVIHDSEQGVNHLETQGDLPPIFASIRERLAAAQAAEDQDGEGAVDYLIEVPVELAQTLTGFRHDELVLVPNDESAVPPDLSAVLGGHPIFIGDERSDVLPQLATILAGRPIIVGERRFEKLQATSPQMAPPERSEDRWPMVEMAPPERSENRRPIVDRFAYWLLRVLRGR